MSRTPESSSEKPGRTDVSVTGLFTRLKGRLAPPWTRELSARATDLSRQVSAWAERLEASMQETRAGAEEAKEAALEAVSVSETLRKEMRKRLEENEQAISFFRAELGKKTTMLALLSEELKKHGRSNDAGASKEAAAAVTTVLDAQLYSDFEERFRGSVDEIKRRLRVYLPVIANAKAGTAEYPVIDVGSGRGEWLELLRDQGLVARGIDLNSVQATLTRQKGLEVETAEAIGYLKALPESSVGAITAFQVIEHLAFGDFLALIEQAVRVLRPGGIAIFETQNAQNLWVLGNNFYLDPTHLRPVPAPMVKFFMESKGFAKVEPMFVNPLSKEDLQFAGVEGKRAELYLELFAGAQDYAMVGTKV